MSGQGCRSFADERHPAFLIGRVRGMGDGPISDVGGFLLGVRMIGTLMEVMIRVNGETLE